jgi:hypothetical protein
MSKDVVPKVPGKQLAGYFKGVEKDKKAARACQFKRQATMNSGEKFSHINFGEF